MKTESGDGRGKGFRKLYCDHVGMNQFGRNDRPGDFSNFVD
jgi:hypothetical protein